MRPWLRLALLLPLLLTPTGLAAQHRAPTLSSAALADRAPQGQRPARPPAGADRLLVQAGAGVLGGVLGAIVVTGVLLPAFSHEADDGWGALAAVGVGAMTGYPIGAAGGVYLAGRGRERTGSLLATAGGALAGAVAGAVLAPPTGGLSYVVLVPVGATAGFHLTRRWRTPPSP